MFLLQVSIRNITWYQASRDREETGVIIKCDVLWKLLLKPIYEIFNSLKFLKFK